MNVPAECYSRIVSCALLDTNYFYVFIFVLCTWYTSSFVDKDEHIKWNIFMVNRRLWIESLNWWSIIHQYLYQQNEHSPLSFVTRLTRRVPLVEQSLLSLPEHLSSPPVFSGVRVTRSLVLCHRHLFHSKNICPPPFPYFKVNICPQYFSLICDPFADPIISLHSRDISLFDCHI